jgi:hypothetical protein
MRKDAAAALGALEKHVRVTPWIFVCFLSLGAAQQKMFLLLFLGNFRRYIFDMFV